MSAGALCSENEVKTWGPFNAPNSLRFRKDFTPAGPRCFGFVLRSLPALDSPSDCPAKADGSCTVTILHFTPGRDNSRTVPRTPQLASRYASTLTPLRQYPTFSWLLGAFPPPKRASHHVFRFSPSLQLRPNFVPIARQPSLPSLASHLRRRSSLTHPPPASQPVRVRRKSIKLQGACS